MRRPYYNPRETPLALSVDDQRELREKVKAQILPRQNGCWIWTRISTKQKNPALTVFGKTIKFKTLVFWMVTGRMPIGYLKRTCTTEECVNPAHTTEAKISGGRSKKTSTRVVKAARDFYKESDDDEEDHVDSSDEEERHVYESPEDAKQRFWKMVEITSDCWIWKGARLNTGYPRFEYQDTSDARISMFRFALGHRPESKIESTCHTALCVRPSHLIYRKLFKKNGKFETGPLQQHKLAELAEDRALQIQGLPRQKKAYDDEIDF